ncbi:hypothetical protein C7212DRAFT_363326 [Tuber magnatum]|uniref:Uncharacterized protein n=1 Tax=Tuber magnatum TaxID=42249 RepID=A0A317SU77_9PEZI|nr:hypothetical protein C7212DRAFT_363326 [Tuber magnatum]
MSLITSPHFYIFHSSTSYPSHSPHHRPIPRSRTIFPPDPNTKQSNPTKGAKNTTDPAAKRDRKAELPGAVTTDSLAARSLRCGGDFSRGNPTGIIGVTADNSTLNSTTSGGMVCEICRKEIGEERYGEARVDPGESGEVGASGDGDRAIDSFDGDLGGRLFREALGGNAGDSARRPSQTTHAGSDTSGESPRDDDWRHSGSSGDGGKGSKQSTSSGPTGEVDRFLPSAALGGQAKGPGPDWSEIQKDTKPVT